MTQSTPQANAANLTSKERVGTVFIVDDEPMVTTSLKTMLSLDTRHLYHCFNAPDDALNALDEHQPEVVISDFSMPKIDGIAFLQKVKERLPNSTLILLTGYADKENAIKAINSVGLYRYIEKPWDNEVLKLSINTGLERAYLITDLHDTIGDLESTQNELRQTNEKLEQLVQERTRDLQATYHQLRAIVDNSGDAILTLNPQLEITSLNPVAERWLNELNLSEGGSKASYLSAGITNFIQPLERTPLEALLKSAEHALMAEASIGKRVVEMNASPLASQDNVSSDGFVLMLRDITQRKELDRLREDFVSTLTHDLRTPLLAAIQTLGFFIEGDLGELPEQQRELLEMLVHSNKEMLGLVNVLLEVYKYEAGRQKLILDTVDVSAMVNQVHKELDALAKSRDQVLTMSMPEDSVNTQADKQELRRVLMNLTGNAIHHTPAGGNINLALELSAERLTFSVQDNGRGIPEEDLKQLFQRFSQGTSNKRSSGSGLGLYLSRQIIEAHGGHIGVESTVGKGSRFYFHLPLTL